MTTTTTHYKGVAPLTMVRVGVPGGQSYVGVYEDQIVPAGADPDDVARLVTEGFLVETELVADVAEVGLTPEQAQEYADYVQAQHDRIEGLEAALDTVRTDVEAQLKAKDDEIAALTKQLEDATKPPSGTGTSSTSTSGGTSGGTGSGAAKKTATPPKSGS